MKKLLLFVLLSAAVATAYILYKIPAQVIEPKPSDTPAETVERNFTTQAILKADGTSFDLTVPDGYEVYAAADGMKRIRFMAFSPDGRLFLTDMRDLSDNSLGKVYVLSDFNDQTKRFDSQVTYLDNQRNPNSVAFYKDTDGVEWLYVALTDKLIRYKYIDGENAPSNPPQTVATFPDYGLSYKYGGWHLTRTVAFHDDMMYVSVGSSCNACEEKEPVRASILIMNPDGTNQKWYANGLRNAVGLKWVRDDLYATNMGSDHYGDDAPNDMFYKIKAGTNYGWPYCYVDEGKVLQDQDDKWTRDFDCSLVPAPDAALPAHSAPLGLEYFDGSFDDKTLRNSFLVALHGSGQPRIGTGYSIVQIDESGRQSDFISGFLEGTTRHGRPVDILRRDDSSFFFSDDHTGTLYLVVKK